MKDKIVTALQWVAYFSFGLVSSLVATFVVVVIVKLFVKLIMFYWNLW